MAIICGKVRNSPIFHLFFVASFVFYGKNSKFIMTTIKFLALSTAQGGNVLYYWIASLSWVEKHTKNHNKWNGQKKRNTNLFYVAFFVCIKRISFRFSQSENENLERTRQKSAATNETKNSTKKIHKENFQLKNFYYILPFCTIQIIR